MCADDMFIDNGELRKSGRLFSAQEVSQIIKLNHWDQYNCRYQCSCPPPLCPSLNLPLYCYRILYQRLLATRWDHKRLLEHVRMLNRIRTNMKNYWKPPRKYPKRAQMLMNSCSEPSFRSREPSTRARLKIVSSSQMQPLKSPKNLSIPLPVRI